jgi:hypothetical protein
MLTAATYHEQIATEQSIFAERMIEGYLLTLFNAREEHKSYKEIDKKLKNRRLDLDSKLNKVQKSKKENPVLDEETRVAQAKYEETLEVITEKMIQLNTLDEFQQRSLLQFIDYELEYYKKCASIMEELKSSLERKNTASNPQFQRTSSNSQQPKRSQTPVDRQASVSRSSTPGDMQSSVDRSSTPNPISTYTASEVAAPGPSIEIHNPLPARYKSIEKIIPSTQKCRALFDFDGDSPAELNSTFILIKYASVML